MSKLKKSIGFCALVVSVLLGVTYLSSEVRATYEPPSLLADETRSNCASPLSAASTDSAASATYASLIDSGNSH